MNLTHGRILLLVLLIAGCSEVGAPPRERAGPETVLGQSFEPNATGTIRGRVVWEGDVPVAKETVVRASAYNPYLHQKPASFMTPHVPVVDATTGGVADAVVFVKAVDTCHARPWDHAKVRVEFRDRQLHVVQGGHSGGVGFVRRGGTVEVVNREAEYHNLRGRGAACFSLPLVESNQVTERTLAEAGIVDLSCSSGWYWLHAHLFVVEHPYYARTDRDGNFVLDRVPPGEYELVCWLPSWRVARTDIDPETANIARLAWEAPKEQIQRVRVDSGQTGDVTYRWKRAMFGDRNP